MLWKQSRKSPKKYAIRTGCKTVAKSESDDDKEDRNAIGNDGAQPGGSLGGKVYVDNLKMTRWDR